MDFKSDFVEKRPQRLCRMCGRCCRVVTTSAPYAALIQAAKNGDKAAMDFLEIFEPYPSIEVARSVDKGVVDNVIKALKGDGHTNFEDLTFYGCRFLQDNNMCSRYETRKDLCDFFPSSPWAVVPPGCGFEGWLFLKREETKMKVRKMKENIISFELQLKTEENEEMRENLEHAIKTMNKTIGMLEKYGSKDW